MYEFWFDYIKPMHQDRAKLCYMDAGGFVVYINCIKHIKLKIFIKKLLITLKNCLTQKTAAEMMITCF